ncbi:hypothetical protein GCM10027168_16960 [Streptomyces capparidis]
MSRIAESRPVRCFPARILRQPMGRDNPDLRKSQPGSAPAAAGQAQEDPATGREGTAPSPARAQSCRNAYAAEDIVM